MNWNKLCVLCKKTKQTSKEIKTPYFSCDPCRNLACFGMFWMQWIVLIGIKSLSLLKSLMKFHCNKCRNNKLIDILKNIINDKKSTVNDSAFPRSSSSLFWPFSLRKLASLLFIHFVHNNHRKVNLGHPLSSL